MLPVVHGAETALAGRVTFLYIDVSEERTKAVQEKLKFKGSPQFVILDADGRVLAERMGVFSAAEFERWILDAID